MNKSVNAISSGSGISDGFDSWMPEEAETKTNKKMMSSAFFMFYP